MQIISKLTGQPVSDELQSAIDKLNAGEPVEMEELNRVPEIQAARNATAGMTSTHLLSHKQRRVLRDQVQRQIEERGSIKSQDANGNELFDGTIEHDKVMHIVMGLPASGKSSTIAEPLSTLNNARLCDSDEVKKALPEYGKGEGAGIVHAESSNISNRILVNAMLDGENIVLPVTGNNANKLYEQKIQDAVEQGYTVYLHHVEVPKEKAEARMLTRFAETGRFIEPAVLEDMAPENDKQRILHNFEELREKPEITGWSLWDNDVELGSSPKLVACDGVDPQIIEALEHPETLSHSTSTEQQQTSQGRQTGADNNLDVAMDR